SPPT
ncbi:hypothetical protein MIMGU_mgv1a0077762mg, partial [Erythranthe guttata]